MIEKMPCPSCSGTGKIVGFLCGPAGCDLGPHQCFDCLGCGIVERDPAWLVAGQEQRKRRVARDESLREMSRRCGVSPVQLSNEERGRVEPKGDR